MPPECWPRWRGRSCISRHSGANGGRAAVEVEADRGEIAAAASRPDRELEVVHHLGEAIDLRRLEAERLAHFARRAAAAIGDDVGGHRRAVPAVLLVDVLDHLLAPIAARQIEIDVGPLAALLRQEALEEQIHADRIDRGDAEAVADGAVGGRAASLHEDVVLAAEIDDVPDDQEVAGELELLDQIELARDLRARPLVMAGSARARQSASAQERRSLARRHGIVGEAVAEIGHRVLQPIGELASGRRLRMIANSAPSPPAASGTARRSARAGGRPRASVVWWWMQVRTSNSGRSAGVEADAVGRDVGTRKATPGSRAPRCRAPRRAKMTLQLDVDAAALASLRPGSEGFPMRLRGIAAALIFAFPLPQPQPRQIQDLRVPRGPPGPAAPDLR